MGLLIESLEFTCSFEKEFSFNFENVPRILSCLSDSFPDTRLNQDLGFAALINTKDKKFILLNRFEIKIEYKEVRDITRAMQEIIDVVECIRNETNFDQDKATYSLYTDTLHKLEHEDWLKFINSINRSVDKYDYSMLGAESYQAVLLLTDIRIGGHSFSIGVQPHVDDNKYYVVATVKIEPIEGILNIKNKLDTYYKIIDNGRDFICSNFI